MKEIKNAVASPAKKEYWQEEILKLKGKLSSAAETDKPKILQEIKDAEALLKEFGNATDIKTKWDRRHDVLRRIILQVSGYSTTSDMLLKTWDELPKDVQEKMTSETTLYFGNVEAQNSLRIGDKYSNGLDEGQVVATFEEGFQVLWNTGEVTTEFINREISKSEISEEISHHIKDKGMSQQQAIAAAYSEADFSKKNVGDKPSTCKCAHSSVDHDEFGCQNSACECLKYDSFYDSSAKDYDVPAAKGTTENKLSSGESKGIVDPATKNPQINFVGTNMNDDDASPDRFSPTSREDDKRFVITKTKNDQYYKVYDRFLQKMRGEFDRRSEAVSQANKFNQMRGWEI